MRIGDNGIRQTLTHLLPRIVVGGRIANTIQDAIREKLLADLSPKAALGRFGAAITDADILVENLIGRFIASTFEDASFDGEEYERDGISKEIPKGRPYTITLDPVNGTKYFADGLPIYDVILTIRRANEYLGAIVYLPRSERAYIGIAGEGAFTTTATAIASHAPWEVFHLSTPTNAFVLTHRPEPGELDTLRAAGFVPIDQEAEYDGSPDWPFTSHGVLTGSIVALVKHHAHLIDWGAIGFIAALAGGGYMDTGFRPETGRADFMIVAADPRTFDRITHALPGAGKDNCP